MTETQSFVQLLLVLAAVLLTARCLSALAEKIGQPAILGELVAGILLGASVPVWFKGNKALVGTAMLPRGEVELIVAQTGLAIGALNASLFGAITVMVLLTTLLSPTLIQAVARRDPRARELMPVKLVR